MKHEKHELTVEDLDRLHEALRDACEEDLEDKILNLIASLRSQNSKWQNKLRMIHKITSYDD